MTEEEFIVRWNSERAMYEAWGQYVVSRIKDGVTSIAPLAADLFIRIPPKPRVKTDPSILEKAFRRKQYADPYDGITDKVGARFVVLLGRDISLVSEIIENCETWTCSRDRDYTREQEERPIQFEYAAVHYVVRCRSEVQTEGYVVPVGTPCEVQVKTILQHAYSELTHDTIYKPTVIASADMKRAAAKSMALLEATGDYFEKIVTQVEQATAPAKDFSIQLGEIYRSAVGIGPEVTRSEGIILEAFEDEIGEDALDRIRRLIKLKPFIGDKIKNRLSGGLIFRQPSILVAYLMVSEKPSLAKTRWPFTPEELRPIYTDLGAAFDSY